MPTYRVVHATKYRFEAPVAACTVEARLAARALPHQEPLFHQLVVRPLAGARHEAEDAFGNPVSRFEVPARHQTLEVTAINKVRTAAPAAPAPEATPDWAEARAAAADAAELAPFLAASPHVGLDGVFADYAAASFPAGHKLLAGAQDLMHRLYRDIAYDPDASTVATTAEDALAAGRGVCQDLAHVMLGCLRALGLPARYVSGYLDTAPDTTQADGGARRIGADASHAWVGLWLPGGGWADLDPTNDRPADAGHITLAFGGDYADIAPLQGIATGGGRHTLGVSVDVAREEDWV